MREKKITIVIPCFNEELTVEKVIEDFRNQFPQALQPEFFADNFPGIEADRP